MISEQRWPYGIYLLADCLVFRVSDDRIHLIPKERVLRPEKPENSASWQITFDNLGYINADETEKTLGISSLYVADSDLRAADFMKALNHWLSNDSCGDVQAHAPDSAPVVDIVEEKQATLKQELTEIDTETVSMTKKQRIKVAIVELLLYGGFVNLCFVGEFCFMTNCQTLSIL
ncbi:hypothetical protein CSB45_12670 [candidate division KSB3 bacterium]|uniref:Uncharacterized protein n=1 Tax=candidate division KSB3 bacterium TaxID=2044937 RepID=A0A2G6E1X1_9BACT|nr:MAG: hypothetical protein CSB45_12670 [candidate division KSB3 bacterium]PIE28801.1 MAG: hypothetical protein CSA57_12275 [candidate division KSB3 bacterium]